jgi:hypothetical protein
MIDTWRYLDDWNKPANKENKIMEQFFLEAKFNSDFAANKRVHSSWENYRSGGRIPDNELEFAYIDGDHTLKGIAIDLIRLFPKIRDGGWIGGDDFSKTVWQHSTIFEPTLVFPFAVYFAEAVGAQIYALPNSQSLIEKNKDQASAFIDLTGDYVDTSLRKQFRLNNILKLKLKENFIWKVARRAKQLLSSKNL